MADDNTKSEKLSLENIPISETEVLIAERTKIVWQEAKPVMDEWKVRLEAYQQKHQDSIKNLTSTFTAFFNRPSPETINVDLHYHPRKDSLKGEPARGLASTMRIPEGDSDIFYWVGKVTRLPTDGPVQLDEEEQRATTQVLHETIHQELQRDYFDAILAQANQDEEIIAMRKELMAGQASYLEPEAEMTAIHLEYYAKAQLAKAQPQTITSETALINYRVDEKRFGEIFKAVVETDNEWKQDGPYTALRRGWGLPDVVRESSAPDHNHTDGPSIYKLGSEIKDFSLIERYIHENHPFDKDFLKELYLLYLAQKRQASPSPA